MLLPVAPTACIPVIVIKIRLYPSSKIKASPAKFNWIRNSGRRESVTYRQSYFQIYNVIMDVGKFFIAFSEDSVYIIITVSNFVFLLYRLQILYSSYRSYWYRSEWVSRRTTCSSRSSCTTSLKCRCCITITFPP